MSRHTVLIRLFAFLVLSMLVFVVALTSPARAECPEGMISYWKLNETTGDVYLDDYNGNDGLCAGTCPTPATGKIDGGQLFDGSTTGISVLASDSFNWTATDSFSIEYWMKRAPGTLADNEVIVGRDDPTTLLHWWTGIWSGGKAAFVLKATNGDGSNPVEFLHGTTDLVDGSWHHIVVIRNAGTGQNLLYVDGQIEDFESIDYSAGFQSSAAALNMGCLNFGGGYHFGGTIDEVALYDRVLSETEIRTHYYLARAYCDTCDAPVRIMPIGNSITYDNHEGDTRPAGLRTGYRQPLWLSLVDAGYNVDFVGSVVAGEDAEPSFNPDNEGHPGWADDEVELYVYSWLETNPADVVLLHIGTCDLDTSPDDVEDILDEIDRYENDHGADVTVILARIINWSTYNSTVTAFNNNVQAIAEARIASGDKIIIVDMEDGAGLDYDLQPEGDMYDDLHPNDVGYAKMANVWLDALDDFLPVCAPPTPTAPTITSPPVTEATVGRLYTYDVDAMGYPAPNYALLDDPDPIPPGMMINEGSGLIEWTSDAPGNFSVTVKAWNSEGEDTQPFTIEVDEAPPCPEGMTSYWKLDETSGSIFEDFYNGNHGACAGGCPTSALGQVNGAQEFDDNTGIDVPADASFDWAATDSFSIEYWMKRAPGTLAGNEVIVGRDDTLSSSLHWWTGILSGGEASFILISTNGDGTGTDLYLHGTTDLTDGSWHHIVVVRDASTERNILYVDGREEASVVVTYSAGFDSVTAALNIGWLNLSGGFHFGGTLDELALYDRALPDVEIQQHYFNGQAERGYCEIFAPEIMSTAVTEAMVGMKYIYDVNAAGNPAPTYALTNPPVLMTIDEDTGKIVWTPDAGDIGTVEVTVVASNGELPDATQPFTITVAEADCPADMISYWTLDETSYGSYMDIYNGNDGVCAGVCPIPTTGKINGGQAFNGSTTGIDVPADLSFDWGATDSFSIEYWMKRAPGTLAGNEVIVGRDDTLSSSLHWWTGILSGGEASFILISTNGDGTGTDLYLHGTTDLTDGSWHHIVVVRDASTERNILYVDGREEASVVVTYSAGFDSVTAALNIGWLNLSGGFHFGGTLDELALYDRALPDVEIQQHYFNGQAEYGYCTVFAPEIISTAVAEATVGRLYTYDVNAAGNPAPEYALDSAPAGMTIDSESGLISWTPDVADDYGVTVIATNGEVPDASQAFTITVTVNSPPVADDQAVTTAEDTSVAITLTGSDPDGDDLDFSVLDQPAQGELTGTAPALTYTPVADYNGPDSFTFQVYDGTAYSDVATVSITINPINDAPVAIDDAYGGVDEGGTLTKNAEDGVLANDSDIDTDKDLLTAALVSGVSYGTLTFNPDGSFIYTHDGSENTSDSFTYQANDGVNDSNVATVTITIYPINDAPVADDQAVNTDEDTAVGITLTGSDPEEDPLTFIVVNGPAHGTLTGTPPALTYTPDADYNGTDSFTFQVYDGTVYSDVATVSITVNPENDAPVADDDAYSGVDEGGTFTIDAASGVLSNDSDTENDPLTAVLVSTVSHGTLTLNANGSFTYTHNGTENTSDTFTYKANDDIADSNVATVTITIIPRPIALPGVLLLLL